MDVYVSIGNSDDKLSQKEWAEFRLEVDGLLVMRTKVHGAWVSESASQFQNACWCVSFDATEPYFETGFLLMDHVIQRLEDLAAKYGQESISWAPAETMFIRPTS